MQSIAEFKAAQGVAKLSFYKSKTTNRHVASNNVFMLVTTDDFDASKPGHVYKANEEAQAGSELALYWLSNKAQADAAFEL